jgi:LytS/YehU family sensor histidine kinase
MSGLVFIFLSWIIAYFIYPKTGDERINLPFFFINRFLFLFVPTIFEIFIQNGELRKKFEKIQLVEQILQLNQQLNPHLLFNTLTTLHHQILIKSPKAELISVKLRDLMEYSLNQSTNVWATLESEINFIKSYIEVEKIALQKESQLQFHAQCNDLSIKVPAMIFIVFLENAFKHSDIEVNESGFIEAILLSEPNQILFQVKNSKTSSNNKKSKKIGLENVHRRLDIMFPKKYKLVVSDKDMIYQVNLRLNLTQTAFP